LQPNRNMVVRGGDMGATKAAASGRQEAKGGGVGRGRGGGVYERLPVETRA